MLEISMAKKNRILPFGIWPMAWGMAGTTRAVAEAEYYYDGIDLEFELSKISNADDSTEYMRDRLRIEHKYEVISLGEMEVGLAEIENSISDSDFNKLALLEVKMNHDMIEEKEHDYAVAEIRDDEGTWLGVRHKHGEITTNEFAKDMATLRGEPWVMFTDINLDGESGSIGNFELDWNDKFVEVIKAEGHVALTDEGCVDLWLTEVSKNIALEELSGTGVFDDDAEESYLLKKKRLSNGKSEYK